MNEKIESTNSYIIIAVSKCFTRFFLLQSLFTIFIK